MNSLHKKNHSYDYNNNHVGKHKLTIGGVI